MRCVYFVMPRKEFPQMELYKQMEQRAEEYKAAAHKILSEAGPEGLDSLQNAAFENLRGKVEETQNVAKELKDAEIERLTGIVAGQTPQPSAKTATDFRDMPRDRDLTLVKNALVAGSSSGSYLVDEEWDSQVAQYRFESNFLRENGAQIVRTSTTHNIPILTANGTAAITGENAAYTAVDPTIGEVVLHAYKLTQKIPVSEELLADAAYDVAGLLAKSVGIGFGLAEETYFLTGDGSSKPTGIFNKAADKTLASASAITKDELIEASYGLARQYRRGAGWMMNDSTALYVAKLKLDVTTSGTTPYFWTDAVGGEPPMLLGYPVWTHSAIAAIGATTKVIALGAPSEYIIAERGPMAAKRLVLSEYGDTFAFNHRIDGTPQNAAAFYVVAMHA